MRSWKKNRTKGREIYQSNNRINFIMAIIFLLAGLILFQLYNLQVVEYDLWAASALGQHQIFSQLEPERGRIFIHNNAESDVGNMLYSISTNKNFALVYAVPDKIKDAERIAEVLYSVFKQAEVEREVEKLMFEQDKERLEKELAFIENLPEQEKIIKKQEVIKNHEALIVDKDYLEIKNIKRDLEIESRKDIIIGEYLKILKKKNDPYEPIAQKVDEETLKKLYTGLANGQGADITTEDLKIKDNVILLKNINGEIEELKINGIAFKMKTHRFYTEDNIGSHILGFVGFSGDKQQGKYGLEGFFDQELYGKFGSIRTGRSAGGDLIIINDRQYTKPQNGSDLILTIDRSIQWMACQKLNAAALRHGADGGSIIIMEPQSGAIIAMCSWPDYDPNNYQNVDDIKVYNNPAIFNQYEPGSIFKAITMAAALDQEKLTADTTYNDEGSVKIAGWPKLIKNSDYDTHGGHGIVNMNTVLEMSLNTGAIYAMQQIGSEVFSQYVKKFGFGEKTGIELETESAGDIRNLTAKKIKPISAATASYGHGITATPLQMIVAYAAIANGGILMKPYLVKKIVHTDGAKDVTKPKQIRRVISERTAILLSGMLVNVVESGHAKRAGADGYYVAGKTGTAQVASAAARGYGGKTIHTFVGFAPVDEPKFVMLVKLDDPKDVRFAASSAAPLFGEIAEFLLNYWQVEKER
ncbi:MAG: penicillin-binding protein 2 [Patescibacteria group bacterium]|nr:penicillin-binding protein 2 [Patescibacteria group bacterium]